VSQRRDMLMTAQQNGSCEAVVSQRRDVFVVAQHNAHTVGHRYAHNARAPGGQKKPGVDIGDMLERGSWSVARASAARIAGPEGGCSHCARGIGATAGRLTGAVLGGPNGGGLGWANR
jgi:hypothetical protein